MSRTGTRVLFKQCGICNKPFETSSIGYHRILHDDTGYHTVYYCSTKCKQASYIRDIYGNSMKKHIEYDKERCNSEEYKIKRKMWNKLYYERNKEKEKARQKKYRQEHYTECLEAVRYNRKKNKILKAN